MSPPKTPSLCTEDLLYHDVIPSDLVHSRIDHEEKSSRTPNPRRCHRIPSLPERWRGGLFLNMSLALLALVANVSFFAWATRIPANPDDTAFPMKCEDAESLSSLGHAMVNILSTMLLSASNYTMQLLSSPRRTEVDSAHRQGNFLTIGVQSVKNLRSIGLYRVTLWSLLAISSMPLHLLYNSVIFPVTGSYAYMVAVASADFDNGAPFNLTRVNKLDSSYSDPLFSTGYRTYLNRDANPEWYSSPLQLPMTDESGQSALLAMQQKAQRKELIELTPEECLRTYLPESQKVYRNLVAVSDRAQSNTSVVWMYYISPQSDTSSTWICQHGSITSTNEIDLGYLGSSRNLSLVPNATESDCDPKQMAGNASDWSLGLYSVRNQSYIAPNEAWDVGSHPISRCLAEPVTSSCGLQYIKNIHIIVIAANVVKVLVMAATMFQYRRPALVTVGDALASFLETPDPTTQGMCLGQREDFTQRSWTSQPKMYSVTKQASLRSSGASRTQWVATSVMFALSGLTATICFALIYVPYTSSLSYSFANTILPATLTLGHGMSVTPLIILANTPQLVLSLDYMLLNRLVTSMAAAREWAHFAHRRKPLRTSAPRGAQRSTYWLALPLRISVPLMAASAALHYLVSQCLFFGSVKYYAYHDGADGRRQVLEDFTGLGYSQTDMQFFSTGLLLTMAAVVWWGRGRNELGMPPSGSCSAVVSAACHPPAGEEDVHLQSVQWGEVAQPDDLNGVGHCSFSSEEVTLPVVGKEYA